MDISLKSSNQGWWGFVARGILFIALGIYMICFPAGTAMAVLCLILGVFFLFRGISLLVFFRKKGRSWALAMGALMIVVFGVVMLFFNPAFGDKTIIPWTADTFIIVGIFYALIGFGLK